MYLLHCNFYSLFLFCSIIFGFKTLPRALRLSDCLTLFVLAWKKVSRTFQTLTAFSLWCKHHFQLLEMAASTLEHSGFLAHEQVWGKMWENLWVCTLGPLNAPIQSEAIIEFSESDFDSETLKMASHWTGTFKGPNVCAQRFSRILLLSHFASC